jgi:tripartite-type tricarboxylate transporter receptor subunit TctC
MVRTFVSVSAVAATVIAAGIGAASAADFYKGKRITLYVAASPGGGYATYARAIARHWDRYIPGSPRFTVKHKMGAQGLVAASYLANKSKRDGTEILASYREAVTVSPLTTKKGVHYDPVKFGFIGSADQGFGTCIANKSTGIKTLDDAMKKEVRLGATHHRSTGYTAAYFMNNMFGTKFVVHHGYPAGTFIVLALERGEVDARCGWSVSSMRAMKPEWLAGGPVNILVQLSLTSHPDLKGKVPLIMDYAKTEEHRNLLKLILTPESVGRPYITPPGLPQERLQLLRASFMATLKDKNFLKDAEKQRIDISPVKGEELKALVVDLFKTPKAMVDRYLEVTTKSDSVKLVKVEIPFQTQKVKVAGIKREGRRVSFELKNQNVTVSVGGKTKITIAGKKAKRKAIKVGMSCEITHQGSGTGAKSIICD